MSDGLKNLNFTFTQRVLARRGVFSADDWNNSFEEIATDLAYLTSEWNTKLTNLLDTIPKGDEDTSIDAYANGLDGRSIWVDSSVSASSTDQTYYDASNTRPVSVKEAFDDVYAQIDVELETLKAEIVAATGALTDEERARIGANVFDATATSSSTSLDGKSENNRLNVVQLAKDLYDAGSYTLDNDGAANLTYSLKDMVDALLLIHNGSWNSDITVDHAGISVSVSQGDINSTAPGNDSFAGSPTDLEEDLDQIRTRIKVIGGTVGWQSTLPTLYTGGADSLKDLLDSTQGTGTQTATNPWGYSWDDVDGLETRLTAVRTFTGMGSLTDSHPAYSSLNFVDAGDPLELAISVLDSVLGPVSGYNAAVQTFIGQDSPIDAIPDYSSTSIVSDGDSLETAIGKLDAAIGKPVIPSSGIYQTEAFTASANTVYRLDSTASGFNISLPSVSGIQSDEITFKNQPLSASGVITLYPYGSETIDSFGDFVINAPSQAVTLVSDGISDWMVKSHHDPDEVFSVKRFGATGDGVTDDTQAFLDALQQGHGAVWVPPGEYKISSNLVLRPGTHIYGDRYRSVLKPTAAVTIALSMVEHTYVEGITINGANTSGAIGILIGLNHDTFCLLDNSIIREFKGSGAAGVWLASAIDPRVTNCWIYNNQRGVYANGESLATVPQLTNCYLTTSVEEGLLVEEGYVLNCTSCTFEASGKEGVKLDSTGDEPVADCLFTSCWFELNCLSSGTYSFVSDSARFAISNSYFFGGPASEKAIQATGSSRFSFDHVAFYNGTAIVSIEGYSIGYFLNIPAYINPEVAISVGSTAYLDRGKEDNLIDSRYYYGSFQTTVEQEASLGRQRTILIQSAQTLSNDLGIPDYFTLRFVEGGSISVDPSRHLVISGVVEAGPRQIFTGEGNISIPNMPEVHYQWWGQKNNNTLFQGAIDSAGTITAVSGVVSSGILQGEEAVIGSNTVLWDDFHPTTPDPEPPNQWWHTGDTVFNTSPSTTSGVASWHCVTSGVVGEWDPVYTIKEVPQNHYVPVWSGGLDVAQWQPTVLYAEHVSALRALSGEQGQMALLGGYYAADDGGGGVFTWDTSAVADNGGTIFNNGAATSAGWRRVYGEDSVDVKWFGAKGDASTDDTVAFTAAFALTPTTLVIPAGTFKITSNLTPSAGTKIVGEHTKSILQPSSAITTALTITDKSSLEGVTLDGQNTSGAIGLYLGETLSSGIRVENVAITNFKGDNAVGIKVSNCVAPHLSNCSTNNSTIGAMCSGSNMPRRPLFENCSFVNSVHQGILVEEAYHGSWNNCLLEGNGVEGVKLTSAGGSIGHSFNNCRFEGNVTTSGYYQMIAEGSTDLSVRDTSFANASGIRVANTTFLLENVSIVGQSSDISIEGNSYGSILAPQSNYTTTSVVVVSGSNIYNRGELDFLDWIPWIPTVDCGGSMTATGINIKEARYSLVGKTCHMMLSFACALGGTAASIVRATFPADIRPRSNEMFFPAYVQDGNGVFAVGWCSPTNTSDLINFYKVAANNFTLGNSAEFRANFSFEVE